MVASPRRTPGQTLFTLIMVLIGIWIGTLIVRAQFYDKAESLEPHMRPQLHLRDASPQDLVDAGFDAAALAIPWTNISLRVHQDAEHNFIQVLACDIAPDAVDKVLQVEAGARRPSAAQPPPWWPWEREAGSLFRVPDWFTPQGEQEVVLERRMPGTHPVWEGLFAVYDSQQERLWIWQWRRRDWRPPELPSTSLEPIDALAQGIGSHLIALRTPVAEDGWIHRPALDVRYSGVPPEVLPEGLRSLDVSLRPHPRPAGGHDLLLSLRGVSEEQLPLLLRDHPLRPLPADSPPPRQDWDFASPQAWPQWFAPSRGPRWATSLIIPGSGALLSGRWVAYDPEEQHLWVWDWARPQAVHGKSDIVQGQAMPNWPSDPWELPSPID